MSHRLDALRRGAESVRALRTIATITEVGSVRRYVVVQISSSVAEALLSALMPVIVGLFLAFLGRHSGQTGYRVTYEWLIAAFGATLAANLGVVQLRTWCASRYAEDLCAAVRARILVRVVASATSDGAGPPPDTGEAVTAMNVEVSSLQATVGAAVPQLLSRALVVLVVGVTTVVVAPRIALVVLGVSVLVFAAIRPFLARLRRTTIESVDAAQRMNERVAELTDSDGMLLVETYGSVPLLRDEVLHGVAEVRRRRLAISRTRVLFMTVVGLFAVALTVCTYLVAGLDVLAGRLDQASVVTLALLVTRLFTPLSELATSSGQSGAHLVVLSRLAERLVPPPPDVEPGEALAVPSGAMAIDLERASYRYDAVDAVTDGDRVDGRTGDPDDRVGAEEPDGSVEALRPATLHLDPGDGIGIVGPTGSGKSTLMRLLAGLSLPEEGNVLMAGTSTRRIRLDELRRRIVLVPQRPLLVSGTIEQNITLGDEEFGRDGVLATLAALGLEDWVESMPAGLDSQVTSGGTGLSGGQAQIVGLVRAVLRRPQVLVLDEATAQIDLETEQALLERLRQHLPGTTLVVVSHRASSVRWADRLIEVRDGQVHET